MRIEGGQRSVDCAFGRRMGAEASVAGDARSRSQSRDDRD